MRPLPPDTVVLQVVPELDAGGVEQTTLDMTSAIVTAGGRAITTSAGGRLEGELHARGGELVRLPVQSKNPLTVWRNGARLAELVRREQVGLIHVRSRAPAFSALAAARRTGTPLVGTYHGVYGANGPLKRWYNAVMTRGDLVIANSAFTREHVMAEHGVPAEKVIAIPRGVDLARFDPSAVAAERVSALRAAWDIVPEERRPVLLLAGRLTRWKGQSLVIDALRRLKERGTAAVLVIAGDDQGRAGYREELLAQAAAAGLGQAVRVVGHCEDMPAAYLACDMALAPSIRPEAFGRTAVEPQAMERPVLAADHGAPSETVEHGVTGWLVEPASPEAWADAISVALATSPERRARMGRAGRARVAARYSLDAMTSATLDVYARLLAGRR